MSDTPAQTLRQAAEVLRYAAERAIHDQGPRWILGATMNRSKVVVDHPDEPTVLIETYAERLEAVNTYLTRVHPGVGAALADWLDSAAKSAEANVTAAHRVWANSDDTEARDKWIAGMTDQHALAVARQVLGVAE